MQTGRQACRQAGRQADRQAGRQADRQADRQTASETTARLMTIITLIRLDMDKCNLVHCTPNTKHANQGWEASLLALLGRRDAKKPIGSRALLSLFGCAINADNVCDACHAMCGADAAHLTRVVHVVAHAVIQ